MCDKDEGGEAVGKGEKQKKPTNKHGTERDLNRNGQLGLGLGFRIGIGSLEIVNKMDDMLLDEPNGRHQWPPND